MLPSKKIFLTLLLVILGISSSLKSVNAQDSEEALWIGQFEKAMAHWDLIAAQKAADELTKMFPQSDLAFYLQGSLAFYHGDYSRAQEHFKNIKNFKPFEGGDEGLFSLTKSLLKENVHFKSATQVNTEVHYQEGTDALLVPLIAANIQAVFDEVGGALDFHDKQPLIVEIFPNVAAFDAASPLTRADIETSGTVALCKYARILLTTPRSLLRGYPWMDTLSHEYVHYVLTRRWGSTIPVWLHEGIAKYLEGNWHKRRNGNAVSYLSPSFETLLAEALKNDRFVTFEQMHPSFAKLPSAEMAQLAYAQVATFVDFLVTEQGGWSKLFKVLDGLATGLEYPKAFQQAYGVSNQALLVSWKAWLKKKNLRVMEGVDPRTLQFVEQKAQQPENEQASDRKEIEQLKSTSVREHVLLGDLLRYRGRGQAALIEYQRAGAKAPLSPIISNKIAQSYLENRQFEKAEAGLRASLKIYPDEGLSYRLLGDALLAQNQFEKAASAYEESLLINPYNPLVYERLNRIYGKTSQAEKQRQAQQALTILGQFQK